MKKGPFINLHEAWFVDPSGPPICRYIIMVLFELPYSQVKEVEVEFYGLKFEDSKIFFRKKIWNVS